MHGYIEYGLKDKAVIVTGGGTGIGEACAIEFAKAGAKVAVFGRRKDKIEGVRDVCATYTEGAMALSVDVSDKDQVEAGVKEVIKAFGKVDILVNNAGFDNYVDPDSGLTKFDDFFDTFEPDEYLKYFRTHALGHYNMNRAVVPGMVERHFGRVVNVTSILGITATYDSAAYSASKGAATVQSRAFARKYGKDNITFNSVLPGMTMTPLKDDATVEETEYVRSVTPLGRIGESIDVARIVLFLSQEELFVTGQSWIVSGGADIF